MSDIVKFSDHLNILKTNKSFFEIKYPNWTSIIIMSNNEFIIIF